MKVQETAAGFKNFIKNFIRFIASEILPVTPDVRDGILPPCRIWPNCVSSMASGRLHYIEPTYYNISLSEAVKKVKDVLTSIDRAEIIAERDDYLHFEIRSFVAGFIDNLEFYFDDTKKVLHYRSAARSGFYDFGVNRRRLKRIKADLIGW